VSENFIPRSGRETSLSQHRSAGYQYEVEDRLSLSLFGLIETNVFT